MKKTLVGWSGTLLLLCPAISFADCNYTNASQQSSCLAMQAAQEAQRRAQQEEQQRAQQEQQERAREEAQQRAQQQAQERAQQEAQERAQQAAQERSQQQAQERAQQEAQQRAQMQQQQAQRANNTQQSYQSAQPARQPQPAQSFIPRSAAPSGSDSSSRQPSQPTNAARPSATSPASPPGTTVYTPRAGGPASSGNATSATPGVVHSNGATIYTPSARQAEPASGAARSAGGGNAASQAQPASTGRPSQVPSGLARSRPQPPPAVSAPTMQSINSARSHLAGANKAPIPAGAVTPAKNGSYSVQTGDGRQFGVRGNGTLASYKAQGRSATFGGHGQIRTVHTSTVDISRTVGGQRTIKVRRPDQSVVVSLGRRSGYVERPVALGGRTFVSRSYVSGNAHYTRLYTSYTYHGIALVHYVPAYYFVPAFYGWAFYPWQAPVVFAWDQRAAPWYGYYGPYFSYAPAYPRAALWLTDYYLGQVMAAAYAYDTQGGPPAAYPADAGDPDATDDLDADSATPISPGIQQELSNQVEQQVAYENAGAANPEQAPVLDGLPQVLVPNHLFVASSPLNVSTADNLGCDVSIGDVLRLTDTPPDNSPTAELIVTSSRKNDCPAGTEVTISLTDLQEMQNDFRAQLNGGMQALYGVQGQRGMPAAPPSAIAAPPRPAEELPPDDPTVQSQMAAAQQQADNTESQVSQAAFSTSGPPSN